MININKLLTLILVGTIFLSSCSKETEDDKPDKAIFKDEEFKEIIAETLDKDADDLTYDDLDEIYGLDIYYYADRIENTYQYKEICSVTVKKYGYNEVYNTYYDTPVEAREGLESPQDYSYNTQIEEFSGLSDLKLLKNLKSISFFGDSGFRQEDPVKYFSDIKTLEEVSVYNYAVEDLEEIGKLTELHTLSISLDVRNLPEGLEIEYIKDLTPLKNLTKLTTLSLSGNLISDLSPLVGLDNITTLSITQAALGDISPVAEMKSLTSISFYRNGIEDVTPLTKLPKLEDIILDYNYIQDLSPFSALDPDVVKHISLDMNGFSDDTPVRHLGADKVYLGYTPTWDYE